jgi:hypothetical protein
MSAHVEISATIADEIASWQRVFAARKPGVDPRALLKNASNSLWQVLQIDRTVHPEAESSGIPPGDTQDIFAECFRDKQPNGAEVLDFPSGIPVDVPVASAVSIKTSGEFVAAFVPPDYIVDGLMQEGFLYSLTGATGAGKTAVTLRLAASVAWGIPFADRDIKKKRVLYLAAENPDDVRMRWIALSQHMDFDIDTIEVFFIEGVFRISQMADVLKKEADRIGGEFGLVIIDTGPVFYEGDDENNRTQQGNHAKMLRDLITIIPGKPTVVANCHPVKNASSDNLVPAGGGNFLNQVDGNLTAAKNESTTELHWQGKFRGVDFAPLFFQLKTVTHERLKDSKGGLIPTVISTWLTEKAKEEMDRNVDTDRLRVLAILAEDRTISLTDIATKMGWKPYRDGKPNKSMAQRHINSLIARKWVDRDLRITASGEKTLKGE